MLLGAVAFQIGSGLWLLRKKPRGTHGNPAGSRDPEANSNSDLGEVFARRSGARVDAAVFEKPEVHERSTEHERYIGWPELETNMHLSDRVAWETEHHRARSGLADLERSAAKRRAVPEAPAEQRPDIPMGTAKNAVDVGRPPAPRGWRQAPTDPGPYRGVSILRVQEDAEPAGVRVSVATFTGVDYVKHTSIGFDGHAGFD